MQPDVAEPLARVFGQAHTSVINFSDKMLEEMKRHNYVTPTNYLELVQGYVKTLREKQAKVNGCLLIIYINTGLFLAAEPLRTPQQNARMSKQKTQRHPKVVRRAPPSYPS